MIRITDKSQCCGCTACVTACPVQCIVMRRDREGFDYPVANPDICINCGKCEEICPVLEPAAPSEPLASYACRSEEMMNGSSSGGVFPLIARRIADEGGVVFGAVLNEDLTVGHAEAESYEEIDCMRGSKYVQSDLYSVFEDVRNYLDEGRKVIFSGTPCQIAGLGKYLGTKREGLLTIEVACHGVPSPGIWERYVKALEKKYGGKVSDVNFRDKKSGWRQYSFSFLADGRKVSVPRFNDPYMALFLQDMILRPSCYSCPARNGRSGSDLLLADLWNVSKTAAEYNDDKGVSLAVAYTAEGASALEACGIRLKEVEATAAKERNSGFAESVPRPERRDEFFYGLQSTRDIIKYMSGFVQRKPFFIKWYEKVHTLLSKLKRRITG